MLKKKNFNIYIYLDVLHFGTWLINKNLFHSLTPHVFNFFFLNNYKLINKTSNKYK